jgi:hypothetical protein
MDFSHTPSIMQFFHSTLNISYKNLLQDFFTKTTKVANIIKTLFANRSIFAPLSFKFSRINFE